MAKKKVDLSFKFRNHKELLDYLKERKITEDKYINLTIKEIQEMIVNLTEWVFSNIKRYGNCVLTPKTYEVVKKRLKKEFKKYNHKLVIGTNGCKDTILIEKYN